MAALQQLAPNSGNSRQDFELMGRKLVEQGGTDLLQRTLKEIIAKNKALDSEVLKQRKATDAALREIEQDGLSESKALLQSVDHIKRQCGDVIAENAQLQQILDEWEEDDAADADDNTNNNDEQEQEEEEGGEKKPKKKKSKKRPESEAMQKYLEFRDRFRAETDSIRAKTTAQLEETAVLNAETEKLRAEYEEGREAFDKRLNDKIASFKGEDGDRTEEVIRVHNNVQRFEQLQRLLDASARELETLVGEQAQAENAVSLYTEKIAQMTQLRDTSIEVGNNYAEIEKQLLDAVARLETRKKDIVETERQMREEAHKLRTSTCKQLRQRIAHLEKEKSGLETKSRILLQKKQAAVEQK